MKEWQEYRLRIGVRGAVLAEVPRMPNLRYGTYLRLPRRAYN